MKNMLMYVPVLVLSTQIEIIVDDLLSHLIINKF